MSFPGLVVAVGAVDAVDDGASAQVVNGGAGCGRPVDEPVEDGARVLTVAGGSQPVHVAAPCRPPRDRGCPHVSTGAVDNLECGSGVTGGADELSTGLFTLRGCTGLGWFGPEEAVPRRVPAASRFDNVSTQGVDKLWTTRGTGVSATAA